MKMLRLQRSKCLGIPAGQPWTSDGMSCHGMVCSKAQPCRCSHPRVRLPTGSKGSKGLSNTVFLGLDIWGSDRMMSFLKSRTSKILQKCIGSGGKAGFAIPED